MKYSKTHENMDWECSIITAIGINKLLNSIKLDPLPQRLTYSAYVIITRVIIFKWASRGRIVLVQGNQKMPLHFEKNIYFNAHKKYSKLFTISVVEVSELQS